MDREKIIRTINGLLKKHGQDFSVNLKYRTAAGKIRKRHGRYEDLRGEELLLFNPDKGTTGTYALDRIVEISKRDDQ